MTPYKNIFKILGKKQITNNIYTWAWRLTPIIPALWEAEAGTSLELRSLRPAWQHAETPFLEKKYKTY